MVLLVSSRNEAGGRGAGAGGSVSPAARDPESKALSPALAEPAAGRVVLSERRRVGDAARFGAGAGAMGSLAELPLPWMAFGLDCGPRLRGYLAFSLSG